MTIDIDKENCEYLSKKVKIEWTDYRVYRYDERDGDGYIYFKDIDDRYICECDILEIVECKDNLFIGASGIVRTHSWETGSYSTAFSPRFFVRPKDNIDEDGCWKHMGYYFHLGDLKVKIVGRKKW